MSLSDIINYPLTTAGNGSDDTGCGGGRGGGLTVKIRSDYDEPRARFVDQPMQCVFRELTCHAFYE